MIRWCLVMASALMAIGGDDCNAQWYGGQWYGGWNQVYSQAETPYSVAARGRAQMTMAQGFAAESYAKAAVSEEQARNLYLDNEAKFIQLRRANRDAKDARIEQDKAERKAKSLLRPPPKPRVDVYPRLSSDQVDPLTGQISWPDCLSDKDYEADKKIAADALRTQAEYGPNDRTTNTIADVAHRMMKTLTTHYGELGAENYGPCRQFLNSMSVEGNHAQEELK